MTSLPMQTGWPEQMLPSSTGLSQNIGNSGAEDEQFLLRAFRSFAEAAGSLEQSYGRLRAEVERLRCELEKSNSDLAHSLEQNRSMRIHLDRILEGLPCGVVVVMSDGEISRTNPEALRLLGWGADNETAKVRKLAIAALPDAIRQLLERARTEGGEPELNVPGETHCGEPGSALWLAARHACIAPMGDTAAPSSVFILRDVSERKHLEETQAKLRREQALAEVAAVLAHEIRNPLGSLELFAGLLAEAELSAECNRWVEHVQAGVRILAATVNNVLHFHSLPEQRVKEPFGPLLEAVPVDLGELLGWTRDFFGPLARQSQVAFSVQNRVKGVRFRADRHRLEQVLLNLALNAIRAMPGGGWVELAGRTVKTRNGEAAVLAVTDTGPGILPGHLPRIFEPGFTTRAGSPGLGLAVCRKIVEQHGGTIAAGGHPGGGAVFTLTFPLENLPCE